jgi:ribosomal protein S18 acetylase RimI-like enzyme
MHSRPATVDDFDLLVDLHQRWDLAQFGAVEHDADEVRETLGDEATLSERSRLLIDDGRLVAAAWHGIEPTLLVDPGNDPTQWYADLVPWFAARHTDLEALATDEPLRAALVDRGWTHNRSSFELIRAVSPDWTLATAVWPDGIEVTALDEQDVEQIHRLIYVDAGWAEIPGHPERAFDEWRSIFVTDKEDPAQQVIAWRDGRIVGVSMGRIFSDGAGWISQLAVAKSERGRGLGRALLLESLARRIAAGADPVGLSVQAENRSAIGLYLDVGLTIDREWQHFSPPA